MAHPNNESIYIVRGGVSLEITDMVKYHVVEFDGLGMAPLHRLQQRGPMQDGVTDLGYRLDPRSILISIMAYASTPAQFHDRRQELVEIFKPGVTPVTLKWVYSTSAGTRTRCIDCQLTGGLTLASGSMIQQSFNDVVELYAPDPTFYDPELITLQPASLGGGTSFQIPMPVPTFFGAVTINEIVNFDHTEPGAWDVYPVVVVQGPWTTAQISRLASADAPAGQTLYTGTAAAAGKIHTIDLSYGVKTFLDEAGASVLDKWTGDRATWHLAPIYNNVWFYITGADANTRARVEFRKRFIGL